MKTLTIIAALFTITTTVVVAQSSTDDIDNREKLQLGFRGGLNYSNVYDAKGEQFNTDAKVGFVAGALVAIPIDKYIGLQPEILLSQKGFKGNGSILGSKYDFSRTTTYVDIPVQFLLKPSEFITLLAGPQFSYLINQKDVFSSSLVSYQQEQEFKQDNIRKNIFSAVCGIDINMKHFIIDRKSVV